jgi:hypothetical protein
MDFITDLPLVKGFNSILVVVDQGLSKGVINLPPSSYLSNHLDGANVLESIALSLKETLRSFSSLVSRWKNSNSYQPIINSSLPLHDSASLGAMKLFHASMCSSSKVYKVDDRITEAKKSIPNPFHFSYSLFLWMLSITTTPCIQRRVANATGSLP